MTGTRLYEKLTGRAREVTEADLGRPELEVDLWEAVLRDRGVARRLVEYLRARPALLDLEAEAFARVLTTVPGIEAGIAGQVLAVFALQGHLERLAAGSGDLEVEQPENGAAGSPRNASGGGSRGSMPSENGGIGRQEGKTYAAEGDRGGVPQGVGAA